MNMRERVVELEAEAAALRKARAALLASLVNCANAGPCAEHDTNREALAAIDRVLPPAGTEGR